MDSLGFLLISDDDTMEGERKKENGNEMKKRKKKKREKQMNTEIDREELVDDVTPVHYNLCLRKI